MNFLTLTRDIFTGNIKDLAVILFMGILISYVVIFVAYSFGVAEYPPSLNSLFSILLGQFILVSFALWLKKKYPSK